MNEDKKPWESNPAWASGKIASSSDKLVGLWFFAILWSSISAPVTIMGIPKMLKEEKFLPIIITSIFPLIGIILICFCIYKTLQVIKYSKSIFMMSKNPGVIGGNIEGELRLPAKLASAEQIEVRLVNINQVTSGSGKNRSTTRKTVWQTSRTFSREEWKIQNGKVLIPLNMVISYETKEHDRSNSSNCVYWHLEVNAEMPGIDFLTEFEVPVFKTEESDPEVLSSSLDEERILKRQPNMKGITYQELENGIRIFVHPFKFIGAGIGFLTMSLVFSIALAIVIYKSLIIPMIFVFLFVSIFFLLGIHFMLIQSEIVFYENYGQIKSTWLGLGFIREFDLRDIKDITVKIASQSTSSSGKDSCNFTLEFIPKEGKRLTLNSMTSNYDQILWIKAKLKQKIPEL